MLGAHSWFPEDGLGHWGHLCLGGRAAAWLLPQCVDLPPTPPPCHSCKGLLEAGDAVKTGDSWIRENILAALCCSLSFPLSLTQSLGTWGSQASWGFLLLKAVGRWSSTVLNRERGERGFLVIYPQKDCIFYLSSAYVPRILLSL